MRRRPRMMALLGGATLAACTRTVLVVSSRAFNGSAPLGARAQQIAAAARAQNWQILDSLPGRMRVTYTQTEHRVTLDIAYTETEFSFVYVNSAGLNYDGTNVHRAYNEWVSALERQILLQTSVS